MFWGVLPGAKLHPTFNTASTRMLSIVQGRRLMSYFLCAHSAWFCRAAVAATLDAESTGW